MISAGEHDEILDSFYAAATGVTSWKNVLDRLSIVFGCSSTLLGIHEGIVANVVTMQSHNYSREFMSEFFRGEIFVNDPRLPHMDAVAAGSVYYDEMLYDVREMERNPWVKASIDQLGVFDQIGAKLRVPGNRFVSIGLLRTRAEGRVSREAIAAFERLVPPLERACGLGHLIEKEATTRAMLLEEVVSKSDALIMLGRSGNILFLNGAAERLLAENDGMAIRDSVVVASRPPEMRKLERLIAGVLADAGQEGRIAGGRTLVSRPSRKRPYVVTVTAPPPQDAFLGGNTVACIIIVEDLARQPRPARRVLQTLFGLTPRESELAVELVDTTRLDLAAARCGMAINTARNHLQSIFGKSGTNSQTEVVQLFSRLS